MDVVSAKCCLICKSVGFSPLVGETRFKKLDRVPGQFIVQCNNCKIVTRCPSLFSAEFDKNIRIDLRHDKDYAGGETGNIAPHIKDRLAYASKIVRKKTLLDIGCGSGALLVYAKARGWIVFGTEQQESSLETLKNYQIPCFTGDLNAPELKKMEFDLVHMNHVLEHVQDPLETLNDIKSLLKDDGLAIIEVPNEFLSITQRIRRLLKLDGSSMTSYFQHEWFFSARTLGDVCRKTGLKVAFIGTPFRKSDSALRNIALFFAAWVGLGEIIEVHLTKL